MDLKLSPFSKRLNKCNIPYQCCCTVLSVTFLLSLHYVTQVQLSLNHHPVPLPSFIFPTMSHTVTHTTAHSDRHANLLSVTCGQSQSFDMTCECAETCTLTHTAQQVNDLCCMDTSRFTLFFIIREAFSKITQTPIIQLRC